MPIIKSAKKRVRVAEKAAIRNSKTKRSLRTALKAFHKAIMGGDKDVAAKQSDVQSNLDKAVKKGVMHKNKASRLKSQEAAKAKAAATAAPAEKAKKLATAKTPAKKLTAPKTAAAKKSAVKKTPAKKTDK